MLLDRIANPGRTPRVGHPQVITVAELLGRERTVPVRYAAPPPRPSPPPVEPKRGGPWINKASVATAVITFGSVLAVGTTFLPNGHPREDPDTGPSTDVPVTKALTARPPSATPVARPSGRLLSVPAAAGTVAPAPARLLGPTVAGRPINGAHLAPQFQHRPRPQPGLQPQVRPQVQSSRPAPARHAAPAAPVPQAAVPRAAVPRATPPPAAVPSAAVAPATGAPAQAPRSSKANKPGSHRASAQRPATLRKAPGVGRSLNAGKPSGGLGGVVGGLTGGLL